MDRASVTHKKPITNKLPNYNGSGKELRKSKLSKAPFVEKIGDGNIKKAKV